MRDRRPEIEIIEVLSPDDPLLDLDRVVPRQPAPAAPARRRPRRRFGIAAVTLAATLASGGWLIVGGDDAADSSLATTTTAPRVQLAPASAVGEHFLLDPNVLQPYSADIASEPSSRAIYRLWGTTTTADRPWWSVQAFPGTLDDLFFVDAIRTVVEGTEVIQQRDTRTLLTVRDFGDGWVGVVTTSGLSGAAHVRLANDLRRDSTEIVDSGATSGGLGLQQLADEAWESQWLYGDVTSLVRSITTDGTMVTLRVGTGSMAERRLALPYFTGGPAGFTGDGVNGYRRDTGESIAIWSEGGRIFSLTAALTLEELSALRSAVVPVPDSEWEFRMYAASADYRIGDWYVLADGTDELGSGWSAGVQSARRGGRDIVLWWWRTPDGGTRSVEAPTVVWSEPTTIVTRGATYVFMRAFADDDGTIGVLDGAGGLHLAEVQGVESLPDELFGATRLTAPGRVQFSTAM